MGRLADLVTPQNTIRAIDVFGVDLTPRRIRGLLSDVRGDKTIVDVIYAINGKPVDSVRTVENGARALPANASSCCKSNATARCCTCRSQSKGDSGHFRIASRPVRFIYETATSWAVSSASRPIGVRRRPISRPSQCIPTEVAGDFPYSARNRSLAHLLLRSQSSPLPSCAHDSEV
jgi:hypothetical protein